MRLEGEARRAGGRVDVLFGNHEGMNVLRDYRDVLAGFESFSDGRSEERQRRPSTLTRQLPNVPVRRWTGTRG